MGKFDFTQLNKFLGGISGQPRVILTTEFYSIKSLYTYFEKIFKLLELHFKEIFQSHVELRSLVSWKKKRLPSIVYNLASLNITILMVNDDDKKLETSNSIFINTKDFMYTSIYTNIQFFIQSRFCRYWKIKLAKL